MQANSLYKGRAKQNGLSFLRFFGKYLHPAQFINCNDAPEGESESDHLGELTQLACAHVCPELG
jgi:hypothetical protein